MRRKAPTSKLQAPEKHPSFKLQTSSSAVLELGDWNFYGAWMLVLGIFPVTFRRIFFCNE
jgi:hypothetical protein